MKPGETPTRNGGMTTSGQERTVNMPRVNLPSPGRRVWLALVAALLVVWVLSQGVRVIPAGFVGVVFSSFSGVKPDVLQEGIHFVVPFVDHVNLYDARLQEVTLAHDSPNSTDAEGAIRARSKEGLDITADVTVQFRIDRAKAAILHKELGRNYVQTVIRPQVRSKVRDAIGQFSAADIISTQRQAVEASITTSLRDVFSRNNLVLDSVLLRELRIPDSIAKAIEQKQAAEQQVAVERNRLQQSSISAQRAVVEAQGAAKAAIEQAKGEAQALSLRGRALRENPQLIQLTVAEKLAPTIQTVMLPSGGNFLLDLKSLGSAGTAATTAAATTTTTTDKTTP